MSENQKGFAAFLAKKDIVFQQSRYGIDALAQWHRAYLHPC